MPLSILFGIKMLQFSTSTLSSLRQQNYHFWHIETENIKNYESFFYLLSLVAQEIPTSWVNLIIFFFFLKKIDRMECLRFFRVIDINMEFIGERKSILFNSKLKIAPKNHRQVTNQRISFHKFINNSNKPLCHSAIDEWQTKIRIMTTTVRAKKELEHKISVENAKLKYFY